MTSTGGFEESINRFSIAKTGERIYVDLSLENVVTVKPVSLRGSIPLAGLWVHVLQHANNYPVGLLFNLFRTNAPCSTPDSLFIDISFFFHTVLSF